MRYFLLAFALLTFGCGDDDGSVDASADSPCASCDDGMFCNGFESCVDGACQPGEAPCGVGTTCDESLDRCVTTCAVATDADGDGVDSVDCGGTDCDDSNPDRFPGNTEVCNNVDEDCDPTTIGDRDDDEDGFVDARCCNGATCGDDCDDAAPAVHPGEAETCNGIDEDCDGTTDEGVLTTFVVDADRDGHGSDADDAETIMACVPPAGFAAGADDCDDDEPSVHPGAYDRCDMGDVDDDCSGAANDPPGGCGCADGESRGCPLPGLCGRSTQTCVDGAWADCAVVPTDEVCDNGLDENCDGAADDGCVCEEDFRSCGTDEGECSTGIQLCASDGSWGPCTDAIEPAPETCNDLDDDCDGTTDEGVFFRCWEDADGDGYSVPTSPVMEVCASSCPAGYGSIDPTISGNRDCAPEDARAFPGATGSYGTARTGVGGFDFDCDGRETPTDAVIISCVEDADGNCLEPTEGITARRPCGSPVDFIACATEVTSGGNLCFEPFRCRTTDTTCGDRNRVWCR